VFLIRKLILYHKIKLCIDFIYFVLFFYDQQVVVLGVEKNNKEVL